ncbi:hypothetical protein D3C87_1210480 [compost metagenome]
MGAGANAERTHADLARILPGVADQLLDIACRKIVAGDQHQGIADGKADRRQAALRVIRQLRIHAFVDRQGHQIAETYRVAVRRRGSQQLGTDDAPRAAPVIHDHRLPQFTPEGFGDRTQDNVGAGSGDIRHDELDGPLGPLSMSGTGARGGEQGKTQRNGPAGTA